MKIMDPGQSGHMGERKFRIMKLSSSIFEAAAHDGESVMILVIRSRCGDSPGRVIRSYHGVKAELYEKFISAQSATAFFQQAIWERFPSIPVTQSIADAIDQFFAMQPEGAIRLAPAPRMKRRSSHTTERGQLEMSAR